MSDKEPEGWKIFPEGKEIVRICTNGDIYVHGKKVADVDAVWESILRFLSENNSLPEGDTDEQV